MNQNKISSRLKTIIKSACAAAVLPILFIYIMIAKPDYTIMNGLAHIVLPVASWVGDVITWPIRAVGSTIDNIRELSNLRTENEELRVRLDDALRNKNTCEVAIAENQKLARELDIIENKPQKALQVLNKAEKELPSYNVPDNYQSGSVELAKAYAALNKKAEAEKILVSVGDNSKEYLSWYLSLSNNRLIQSSSECSYHLYILSEVSRVLDQIKSAKTSSYMTALNTYAEQCINRGVSLY